MHAITSVHQLEYFRRHLHLQF